MKFKSIAVALTAIALSTALSGCVSASDKNGGAENDTEISVDMPGALPPEEELPETPPAEENKPAVKPVEPEKPKENKISYITVTSDGVNFRSGAGTDYAVRGQAERNTLYAYLDEVNGWYKTYYKNRTVYISKKYCVIMDMPKGGDKTESVIEEGTKLLGTPYVYGAVRYHDGKGNKLKGFTTSAFDCSSLMQYMFYMGADKLIDVTTRTQVLQGTTVSKSNLKRGDLMFFTNATRKDKVGVERIGHVAMYLGDNYILHTASDYAKIEKISATRWGYYIQSQRII